MIAQDLINKYGLDGSSFQTFLWQDPDVRPRNVPNFKENRIDTVIAGDDESEILTKYIGFLSRNNETETIRKLQEKIQLNGFVSKTLQKHEQKDEAIENMLVSSGFSFEGYRILRYSGYISGDAAAEIPRRSDSNVQSLTEALAKIRTEALRNLKEAAYDLDCNAVIGVDFDYITLEPETQSIVAGRTHYEPYIICVTANGNAVVTEKIEG